MSPATNSETRATRQKYNRGSRFYNLFEFPMEWLFYRSWRKLLFSKLTGRSVLEVGVGTGKNLPFYPETHISVPVGIDLSEGMLTHAKQQAGKHKFSLIQADAQNLPFPDASFDAVLATFVFCSVPDPVQGLQELHRVLKNKGRLYLLEHVLPATPFLARIFNNLNAITVRKMGVNINRRTAENIRAAGFDLVTETNLFSTIFKLFIAQPTGAQSLKTPI